MRKVLVVDDDPETRIVVSDYLARLNIDHTVVASGGEALARLVDRPEDYSLVLMDVHMPALSGTETSTWIKDSDINPPRDIPIIALTADERFSQGDDLLKFGMSDVLHKPISLEVLRKMIKKHVA